MKTFKIVALILAVSALLTLLCATTIYAGAAPYPGHQMNVHEQNTTGKVANDLEIYLVGNVHVSRHWNSGANPFKDFTATYDPLSNTTKLRWSNGIVNPGEWVHTCLWIQARHITYRLVTQWTFNEVPIGTVGAPISSDFQDDGQGRIRMQIGNTVENGGPATIGMIQIGTTFNVYTLETLIWNNLDTIPWVITLYNIHLNPGESTDLPTIVVPFGANVVYRYKVSPDGNPADAIEYIGQFTPPTVPEIYPGHQENVHEQNNTGQKANDFEITCKGKVTISSHWNTGTEPFPFQDFSVIYDPGKDITILRWSNGIIEPGKSIDTCIWVEGDITYRMFNTWTWDGRVIHTVGAALSSDFNIPYPGVINMNLVNTPEDGGPTTVALIQIGSTNIPYSLETLTWDNLNNIPWDVTLNNLRIAQGEGISLPYISLLQGEIGLVYRYKVYLDADPANVVEYVGQYVPLQR